MAKFPVEIADMDGVIDAVNYLLSGPGGLGQNFAGYSTYQDGYLTGNLRTPYSQTTPAQLFVAPISITNAEQLDDRTLKYYYATQPLPPFSLGNGLVVEGVNPANYNSANLDAAGFSILEIGVVECTEDYVIVRTVSPVFDYNFDPYISGGTISFTTMNKLTPTDCDIRSKVTGGTDRVFISGQLNETLSYDVGGSTETLTVTVDLNRYTAIPTNDRVNPDFNFGDLYTVARKVYSFPALTGTGTLPLFETIFTTILDEPDPGYYRYTIEVFFESSGSNLEITEDLMVLRSISAQVVKQ